MPPRSPVAPGGGARAPTRRGLGGPRRRRKVGGPVCPAAVCLLLVGAAALSPAFVTASFPLTLLCVSVPHPPPPPCIMHTGAFQRIQDILLNCLGVGMAISSRSRRTRSVFHKLQKRN